jgi:polar amino acid transport system substrate-binding protein
MLQLHGQRFKYGAFFVILLIFFMPFCWSQTASVALTPKKVSLATTIYPPYKAPEILGDGFLVAITRAAFSVMGYQLELTYLPWARLLAESKTDRYHGVLGIWFRPARQSWLAYSQPIGVNNTVLFKHKNFQFEFSGFNSLQPYTLGVVRGYAQPNALKRVDVKIEEVNSDELNVDKLVKRRIEFTLMDQMVMQYQLSKKYPNLDVIEEVGVVESEDTFVAFAKAAPEYQEKLRDFNLGLNKIRLNGTFSKIMTQFGVQQEM